MNKIQQAYHVWQNMGTRYLIFRAGHEWSRKTGKLEKRFPSSVKELSFLSLEEWKEQQTTHFFFDGREGLFMPREVNEQLQARVTRILAGEILFFSKEWKQVNDWHTHPLSGYTYDANLHWSKIADLDPEIGDIKYVWEKARFTFLYDIIRFDYHAGENHGNWVFEQIESWIDANPLNKGPHYKCSQEIALRVLNWIFALNFYKDSDCLTEERWQKIHNSIYRQLEHVYANIDFSRIAVRNNHAITECVALYVSGLLFPFYPNSKMMKRQGKRWLEEEVDYQFYSDGTYLQFSMNYHRVALQTLCWAVRLAERNKENFSERFVLKLRKSLHFLSTCQNELTGQLPNYGNNDGAWFFPLTDTDFRDFRPLLNTLSWILDKKPFYEAVGPWTEDCAWYGFDVRRRERSSATRIKNTAVEVESFYRGGYFICKEDETLTFIKCGAYKDRPGQADNLHLDLWIKEHNALRDAGSYLYNTTEENTLYFAGTKGHNTVMLGGYDQMKKGPRFIWWYWNKKKTAEWKKNALGAVFEGEISAFTYLNKNIKHRRNVTKLKGELVWIVEDEIIHKPTGLPIIQRWHPSAWGHENLTITAADEFGNVVEASIEDGYYSSFYGTKENTKDIAFTTPGNKIVTRIECKVQS